MNNLAVISLFIAFLALLIAIAVLIYVFVTRYGGSFTNSSIFYTITPEMEETRIKLDYSTIVVYSQNPYQGEVYLLQGTAGPGTVIYIANSSERPLGLAGSIGLFIPQEYTSPIGSPYFVPPNSTMVLSLEASNRGYFIGLLR